jgi:hypothetical protein
MTTPDTKCGDDAMRRQKLRVSNEPIQVNVRLPASRVAAVRAAAATKRVPIAAIYEAAVRAYLSPAAQDQRDAMIARPINRLSRAVEGVRWDTKLLVTMVGFAVDYMLAYGPEAMTDAEQEDIQGKSERRGDRFEQWLVRQMAGSESLHSRLQLTTAPQDKDFMAGPGAGT